MSRAAGDAASPWWAVPLSSLYEPEDLCGCRKGVDGILWRRGGGAAGPLSAGGRGAAKSIQVEQLFLVGTVCGKAFLLRLGST